MNKKELQAYLKGVKDGRQQVLAELLALAPEIQDWKPRDTQEPLERVN